MAKERAPRHRRRWFLLALLMSAAAWYIRSRAAVRRVQLAAPPPTPAVAPAKTPAAASEHDFAPVVESLASEQGHPAAMGAGDADGESASTATWESVAPAPVEPDDSLAPAGTGLDIAAELPAASPFDIGAPALDPQPAAAEPAVSAGGVVEPVGSVADAVDVDVADGAAPESAGVEPAVSASEAADPVVVAPAVA
ncbi:MAG: hypothetical protein H0X35_02200 [Pseudonocardiales bacterium]|nr:hypothetical protein [Pseudonocardiales bacterium]